MILKSIRVQNFRSIQDEILDCNNLTMLVGSNSSGKTSFLDALHMFQDTRQKITIDDFYNRDTGNQIIFSVTFDQLSDNFKIQFKKYIQNNQLTVERIFEYSNDEIKSTYHGSMRRHNAFKSIRSEGARLGKRKYDELKKEAKYKDLPNCRNIQQVNEELDKWEEAHPNECTIERDDGQFFGFTQVGMGYLGRYVQFLYVQAAKDVSLYASEGRDSVLTILLKHAIKNKLNANPQIQRFYEKANDEYKKTIKNETRTEIDNLSQLLTDQLRNYVPNVEIHLNWIIDELRVNLPEAMATLIEDGYETKVNFAGHGLQRTFIMTMLQYLSATTNNTQDSKSADMPLIILIIDEPELYQHPNRQRHLFKIFTALSENLAYCMQVVYSTHSPLFIRLDKAEHIRLLRKQSGTGGRPKITKIFSTGLQTLSTKTFQHQGNDSNLSIAQRLHSIQNSLINEGFFAKRVVLVEGRSDRATILGAANVLNIDLENTETSVISVDGKRDLGILAVLFKELNISTYVIWDNDRGNETEVAANKFILKCLRHRQSRFPSRVTNDYAVLDVNREVMLRNTLGSRYNDLLKKYANIYQLKKKTAEKKPIIIEKIFNELHEKEIPPILKQILEKIQQMN